MYSEDRPHVDPIADCRNWFVRCVLVAIVIIAGGCAKDHSVEVDGDEEDRLEMLTRTWEVPADFTDLWVDKIIADGKAAAAETGDPFFPEGGAIDVFFDSVQDLMDSSPIDFPDGASADFSPHRGELTVKNTRANLERIEAEIEKMRPMKMFVLDEALFRRIPPDDDAVAKGEGELAQWRWHVSPALLEVLFANRDTKPEPDPFADGEDPVVKAPQNLKERLEGFGIAFPAGSSAVYNEREQTAVIETGALNLALVEKLFMSIAVGMSREKAFGSR